MNNGGNEKLGLVYFLAYKTLSRENRNCCNYYSDKFSIYLYPMISMAALSIEIALKALIKGETGKLVKEHKLHTLYDKLSVERKKLITEMTIKNYNLKSKKLNTSEYLNEDEFLLKLNDHTNSYTEWRYYYEKGKKAGDLDYLEALMYSTNDIEYEIDKEIEL